MRRVCGIVEEGWQMQKSLTLLSNFSRRYSDYALPHGLWKLGRIQRVLIGRDGLARGANVRVATRGRQHTILLPLLYPLEVFGEMVQQEALPGASSEQGPTTILMVFQTNRSRICTTMVPTVLQTGNIHPRLEELNDALSVQPPRKRMS